MPEGRCNAVDSRYHDDKVMIRVAVDRRVPEASPRVQH
jgi:hypothetical protein